MSSCSDIFMRGRELLNRFDDLMRGIDATPGDGHLAPEDVKDPSINSAMLASAAREMDVIRRGLSAGERSTMRWCFDGLGVPLSAFGAAGFSAAVKRLSFVLDHMRDPKAGDPAFSALLLTGCSDRRVIFLGADYDHDLPEHDAADGDAAVEDGDAADRDSVSADGDSVAADGDVAPVDGDTGDLESSDGDITNHPPVLHELSDQTVVAGERMVLPVAAHDQDPGEELSFYAEPLPDGAVLGDLACETNDDCSVLAFSKRCGEWGACFGNDTNHQADAALVWTPMPGSQEGDHPISVCASDWWGLKDCQTINIHVMAPSDGDADPDSDSDSGPLPCLNVSPPEGLAVAGGSALTEGPGLDYGQVQFGEGVNREISFSNCGDVPVTLGHFAWNDDYTIPPAAEGARVFSETGDLFADRVLAPGESYAADVRFTAGAADIFYASAFQFVSNARLHAWGAGDVFAADPAAPILVGMRGEGRSRTIHVMPPQIDFDTVTTGWCSEVKTIDIRSVDHLIIEVQDIRIGAGSDSSFELAELPPLPTKIGGEGYPQLLSVKARFCPDATYIRKGSIEVQSDAVNAPILSIPLEGEGTVFKDTNAFIKCEPKVDLLVAVDCSDEMDGARGLLMTGMNYLLGEARSSAVDLHLAVISNDLRGAGHKGVMRGTPAVLASSSDPDSYVAMAIEFQERIQSITDGCLGRDEGLETSFRAVSHPLSSAENAGFLREGAKLAVIWLSDKDDEFAPDAAAYGSYLRAMKRGDAEAYAIVGGADYGCHSAARYADPGNRYIEAANACNALGGTHVFSVCDINFNSTFESMTKSILAPKRNYPLSMPADPSSISILYMNRQDVPGWVYSPDVNSVVFSEASAPRAGENIVIGYSARNIQR